MSYSLACRDTGIECAYVAKGETIEDVLKDGAEHAKEVHGYTDEQLNDPAFLEKAKSLIKRN